MEKQPMGSDDFTDITPPSKQSEPPPLLVFGIMCVIVFFGVLFVLRQSPETPTSPSEPVKINYEHARLALRQLKKLKSITSDQINYPTYSTKLMDIKMEFDIQYEEVPEKQHHVKYLLDNAMFHYKWARENWCRYVEEGRIELTDDEKNEIFKHWVTANSDINEIEAAIK